MASDKTQDNSNNNDEHVNVPPLNSSTNTPLASVQLGDDGSENVTIPSTDNSDPIVTVQKGLDAEPQSSSGLASTLRDIEGEDKGDESE